MTKKQIPRKLLILDRDASEQEALTQFLMGRGYEVFRIEDGEETVLFIQKHHINIVLISHMISGMDGLEWCRQIREQEKGDYICIIMLTEKEDAVDQLKGFEEGVDAYLVKPVDFEELDAVIQVGMRTAEYDHVLMEVTDKSDDDKRFDLEPLKKQVPLGTISRQDQVLAKIAVANRLITKKQLAEAFSVQYEKKSVGKKLSLDAIFCQKQWISKDKLNTLRIAVRRQMGKRFGVIAINKGYISQDQVDKALKEQAREFKDTHKCSRLGDILVNSGDLSKAQRDEIRLELQKVSLKSSEKKENTEEQARPSQQVNEVSVYGDTSETNNGNEKPEQQSDKKPENSLSDIKERASFFHISVGKNNLDVTIELKKQTSPVNISADDIKKSLELEGIVYGIVDDVLINKFLKNDAGMQKTLVVARGKPAIPGKDPYLKFYFNRDYLTAGKINEDGEIDYKERGEIPRVKAGELIAEKVPLIKGTDGVDVYNNRIYVPQIEDIKLRCEEGTVISEDGLKVYAKIDGQPHATVGGKISVFSSFDVNGDVDYRTGNIEFEGNINVKGTVKDGFTVKGGSLTAEEILGANIHVKGDVIVKQGIMRAKIEAEGRVSAKYIKEANIRAYGSVIAEKEVLDSKIRTSGEFIAESGKIISSLVAAKKGIIARDIGTVVSEPCTIQVGANEHIRKIVQGFDWSREKIKTTLEKTQADYDALKARLVKVQEKTMALAQEQDDMTKENRSLEEKRDSLKNEGKNSAWVQIEAVLEKNIRIIQSMETQIEKQLEQQETLEERIKTLKKDIEELVDGIEELSDQKQAVVQWAKKDKANPRITVKGSIYGGTKVSGIHVSYILKETVRGVVIEEVKDTNSEDRYVMSFQKAK